MSKIIDDIILLFAFLTAIFCIYSDIKIMQKTDQEESEYYASELQKNEIAELRRINDERNEIWHHRLMQWRN